MYMDRIFELKPKDKQHVTVFVIYYIYIVRKFTEVLQLLVAQKQTESAVMNTLLNWLKNALKNHYKCMGVKYMHALWAVIM